MKRMGWSIDWNRELSTCEPEYYRWTQWIFLRLYEAGLAYRKSAAVKWCPKDQTVLANEQVIDGRCERCGTEVEARTLDQWFFKITDYADRLLDDLRTRAVARAGRHDAAKLDRALARRRGRGSRSTTGPSCRCSRPGPTRSSAPRSSCSRRSIRWPIEMATAEHAGRSPTTSATRRRARRSSARRRARRRASSRAGYVTNPVNGEQIPVWVADYVLAEYGTGAIMAVPAHDERDFEFARGARPRDPAGGRAARRRAAGGRLRRRTPTTRCWSTRASSRGAPRRTGARAIVARLEDEGRRQGHDRLSPARLAALAPALLGLPDPGRPLRGVRHRAGARRPSCRCSCPTSRTTRRAAARRWPRPRTG